MAPFRAFAARAAALLRPRRVERELDRELQAHLALIADDYVHRGMTPEAARAAAVRALGGIDLVKEIHRDHRSLGWIEDLRRDVPYALRGLRRSPGFTIAAILTLALGTGATTAIFGIVSTILLRPLPYRDSDRLVQVAENMVRETSAGPRYGRRMGMSQAEFLDWRARTDAFSHMAGVVNLMNGTVQTADGIVPAPRALVSPALFEMFGVRAVLGRTLIADDEKANADAAVMSTAAWQRFFGSDPSVLGRPVVLNGTPFTIVGVMPPGFEYPERSTLFWTALAPRPGPGTNPFGNVVARLADGVTMAMATDEANVLGPALRSPPPTPTVGFGANAAPPPPDATPTMGGQMRRELNLAGRPRFEVVGIKEQIVAPIRPQLRILSVAVAVVLLSACANVANLLLARGSARRREMGVRLSLGAGRGRLLRQIITESAVLSLAGALAGLVVAAASIALVKTLATVATPRLFQLSINLGDGSLLPRVGELGVDVSTLATALAIALAASVLFGLAPALHLTSPGAVAAIRSGGSRLDGAQPGGTRLRSVLVFAQVVMATTLLVGAALLVSTFVTLQMRDAGYEARNVVTFQLVMPPQTPEERHLAAIERTIARLHEDTRVVSAGYTNIPPFLALTEYGGLFVPPGMTREQMLSDPLRPQTRIVSHGYLPALGGRLLAGRWLGETDGASALPVCVVNRALVERYFGGADPIGTVARVFRSAEYVEDWQIVGVVDDLAQARLDQRPFPLLFADMRQTLAARARMPKDLRIGQGLSGFTTIAVRTHGPPSAIAGEIRSIVRSVDPAVNVDSIADLESLKYGSLVRPRFYAILVGIFAAIAGVLAAVGIYGVLAYAVVHRTQEIGIRMALGATARDVQADVLRRGLSPAILGVAVGLGAAALLTRSLSTMLYGLTPLDPRTYVGVAAAFMAVAALACYLPARRATQVDPLVALRFE
jgi:predicted permease